MLLRALGSPGGPSYVGAAAPTGLENPAMRQQKQNSGGIFPTVSYVLGVRLQTGCESVSTNTL